MNRVRVLALVGLILSLTTIPTTSLFAGSWDGGGDNDGTVIPLAKLMESMGNVYDLDFDAEGGFFGLSPTEILQMLNPENAKPGMPPPGYLGQRHPISYTPEDLTQHGEVRAIQILYKIPSSTDGSDGGIDTETIGI